MFGANEKVGQKYFQDARNELLIVSRFMTLQGEGPFRGKPAFFIRLAKCNLNCSFCDTYFDRGDYYDFNEICYEVDDALMEAFPDGIPDYLKGDDSPRDAVLVLTGGEPMLQKEIVPFFRYMKSEFNYFQIESNGTIYQDLPEYVTLVVSPKCLEKDGKAIKYLEPNKKVLERANCLKFVMSADQDSPYSSIPEWAHEWRKETGREIFISPMNIYNEAPQKYKEEYSQDNKHIANRSQVDEVISFWQPGLLNLEENQKNHEYSAKYCVKHGFTFNLQAHLFASMA